MPSKRLTRQRRSLLISLGILVVGLGVTYTPLPGVKQDILVISGSELQEPLAVLEDLFEQTHLGIEVDIEIQGSQDMINRYIDDTNNDDPTILIPANGVILEELDRRWRAQEQSDPFFEAPRPIVKTTLVGIAWPERGEVLFPTGTFNWDRIEVAMQVGRWEEIGGDPTWGSFDFVMTDPTRSNSGQLTLGLWFLDQLGGVTLNPVQLNQPSIVDRVELVKRSVYLPPRSTDILLQEFIARGPNDADVAMVYESIALFRWDQAQVSQNRPYRIYYLDPSMETTSTAAIVQRDITQAQAEAGRTFVDFLTSPDSQAIFVQHGFRPMNPQVDLLSVANSPWNAGIPGSEVNLSGNVVSLPSKEVIAEINRLWDRAN